MPSPIIEIPPDAEGEGLAAAEELLGQRDRLRRLDGLDRRAGRNAPEERDLDGAPDGRVGDDLERAALVRVPTDAALPLEVRQVLVHRRERGEGEVPSDLLEGRRVAVLGDVPAHVVEELLLPLRDHDVRAKRRKGEKSTCIPDAFRA
jgi:hypothetical protein